MTWVIWRRGQPDASEKHGALRCFLGILAIFAILAILTILSILGVFYAVSAVAVLAYKYTLLTAGSTNGQAVALIPVVFLFTLPVIAAVVLVTAQSTIDGRISLTSLVRGDEHWLRPDFDSVDFMYDVGVGATALLGLGWVVSVAL